MASVCGACCPPVAELRARVPPAPIVPAAAVGWPAWGASGRGICSALGEVESMRIAGSHLETMAPPLASRRADAEPRNLKCLGIPGRPRNPAGGPTRQRGLRLVRPLRCCGPAPTYWGAGLRRCAVSRFLEPVLAPISAPLGTPACAAADGATPARRGAAAGRRWRTEAAGRAREAAPGARQGSENPPQGNENSSRRGNEEEMRGRKGRWPADPHV